MQNNQMAKTIRIHKRGIKFIAMFIVLVSLMTSMILVYAKDVFTSVKDEIQADVVLAPIQSENKAVVQPMKTKIASRGSVDRAEVKLMDVVVENTIIKEEVVKPFKLEPIGTFSLTAYCPCKICCENFAGPALNKTGSLGTGVYEDITVAVDPRLIPYGTKIYIEGLGVRIAGDCGGAIKDRRIDVYYKTHKEALASGLGHTPRKVYIIKETSK